MRWFEAVLGVAVVGMALPLGAASAAAQSRPPFPPTRDAAVTYQVSSSAPGVPASIEVRWSAAAGRMRVDGGLPGYVLLDHGARSAVIVMEALGVMLDAPHGAGVDQFYALEDARRFIRRGSAVVAGRRCTEWQLSDDTANGTACLTAEGVPLRIDGRDSHGRTAHLEASAVSFAGQDPSLFQPPANVHRVDTSALGAKALGALLQGGAAPQAMRRLPGAQP